MYLAMNIEQYKEFYIHFHEPIKNNIIYNGNFIRISYSNEYASFDGVYLLIPLYNISCERYYNKYKCNFNIYHPSYKYLLEKIWLLEESILKKLDIPNKIPEYKIAEQFKNGTIKIFKEIQPTANYSVLLKISGVWETSQNYGLTYKFITEPDT